MKLADIVVENNLCITKNPNGTDKLAPHNYILGFYEKEFETRKDDNVDLLEIGFRHGASLFLWHKYFKKAHIYGADNGSDEALSAQNPVNRNWIDHPNVNTFIGDAYAKSFLSQLPEKFDIIIDDGPHSMSSQLKFIELYIPKLKQGGIAIIEDLQRYGGLCLWPLMLKTPLNYRIEFYDLRDNLSPADDMIFAIRNTKRSVLLNRCLIALKAVSYLFSEPFVILRRLIGKRFS
jgi:hypothetical protein